MAADQQERTAAGKPQASGPLAKVETQKNDVKENQGQEGMVALKYLHTHLLPHYPTS